MSKQSKQDLNLKYSHNIIEHLGLKLYQNKPTNVIAELISNSWDANAHHVNIRLNSDEDAEQIIYICDDGIGMSLEDLQKNYLVIGKKKDSEREPDEGKRKPMGRKGIGKLAPFGIANKVIVLTIKDSKVNMFELDYSEMIESAQNTDGISIYNPLHLISDGALDQINFDNLGLSELITQKSQKFLQKIAQTKNKSGTTIFLCELKTKRTIKINDLIKSIGNRFTVTLNRPDFKVKVNGKEITEEDCFPEWALRIPETGFKTETIVLSKLNNKSAVIKYWVGFVSNLEWSSDEAGVGVYAHGKIAQDRPFTFGVKGREIFSRYMYGVIEADWVDELAEDEISTDRTSINWDNEIFSDFYNLGQAKVKEWIKEFEDYKKANAERANEEIINKIQSSSKIKITSSEVQHVKKLLTDVTPFIDDGSDQKNKVIEATLKAWLHEPARNLIKKLWNDTSESNITSFSNTILKLQEELVPESLSLAVMFSQRVYALTKLEENILTKNETYLQILIESFPWILGNEFEKFICRKSLKNTTIQIVDAKSVLNTDVNTPLENDLKQPDFVFLGDADDNNLVVVELKGPDIGAALTEFKQLRNYLDYIQERFPNANVRGILIAANFSTPIQKQKPDTIEFSTWDMILKRSRREHIDYLAALLEGTEPSASDSRVSQIFELGGDAVKDFISQMSQNNESLATLMRHIESEESSRSRSKRPN